MSALGGDLYLLLCVVVQEQFHSAEDHVEGEGGVEHELVADATLVVQHQGGYDVLDHGDWQVQDALAADVDDENRVLDLTWKHHVLRHEFLHQQGTGYDDIRGWLLGQSVDFPQVEQDNGSVIPVPPKDLNHACVQQLEVEGCDLVWKLGVLPGNFLLDHTISFVHVELGSVERLQDFRLAVGDSNSLALAQVLELLDERNLLVVVLLIVEDESRLEVTEDDHRLVGLISLNGRRTGAVACIHALKDILEVLRFVFEGVVEPLQFIDLKLLALAVFDDCRVVGPWRSLAFGVSVLLEQRLATTIHT